MHIHAADSNSLNTLVEYGVLGIVALLLIAFARTTWTREVERAEAAWKREVDRADRLEAEVSRLNANIQDKAIPALLAAADAVTEATTLIRDMDLDRRRGYRRPHSDGGSEG
jgi:hypothetical protein